MAGDPTPCSACPWTAKGQPDLSDLHRTAAANGAWFCCHVHMGTCWGAKRFSDALTKRKENAQCE